MKLLNTECVKPFLEKILIFEEFSLENGALLPYNL